MQIKTLTLSSAGFPAPLRQIPGPPAVLYHAGAPLTKLLARPRIAIVGSRRVSPYGRQVTEELAAALAERGIVIVSGLALGVDALAHQAALRAGGLAIAVLPGPLDNVVPATNRRLAAAILQKGGALISEYGPGVPPQRHHFIARNRLMAGLAQAVLITEAGNKSGTLHTANFALEQGKDVLAVPGNITSPGSLGTNRLIQAGARPVTSYTDVLDALGLAESIRQTRPAPGRNPAEQAVLDLLQRGVSDGEELLRQSRLPVSAFNQVLTMLEISGRVRPLGANHWAPH